MKKEEAKAMVEQALKHEYTDERKFIRALASYSTLENMGHSAEESLGRGFRVKAEDLFSDAYGTFRGDAEMEGIDVGDEYTTWDKEAKKILVTLQKKKLPLTVENGNHAWNKTGPFTKKKKK